jgi:hypothetical protein
VVTPEVNDGPLNVVLEEGPWDLTTIESGAPVQTDGERLQVGAWVIELADAALWEPQPDWEALRARRAAIEAQLPALRATCVDRARVESLLAVLDSATRANGPRAAIPTAVWMALDALKAGWTGYGDQLREGAAQLAGLGPGLTPGGDDFLCGAMLWAWLAHPRPGAVCRAIAQTAAPRTTTLSAALLRAAAQGECGACWHALFNALTGGHDAKIAEAAQQVLIRGATSGADALAGFLWAGTLICVH